MPGGSVLMTISGGLSDGHGFGFEARADIRDAFSSRPHTNA